MKINTAVETETHLIKAEVEGTGTECQVYVTGPWYLEALGCAALVPVIDPSMESWTTTDEDAIAGTTTYHLTLDIVNGEYDEDGNEVPTSAEVTISVVVTD